MLRCSNITMQFGPNRVLHDVSVAVEPGKLTALIGPSGAGKSTLLRVLSCLEKPDSGSIQVDDHVYRFPWDLSSVECQPWPRVTAVFQQLFLWPHLTLRNNIALPLSLRSVDPQEIQARIEGLIRRFDMAAFIDRYPNQVSGGQRQRAAIARALALKPAYLLLDEITSALDVEQAAAIIKHLEVLKSEGIGILMITHYLGFLERTANEIVFMEKGEVAERGAVQVEVVKEKGVLTEHRWNKILREPSSPGMQKFLASFNEIENTTPWSDEQLTLIAEGILARCRRSPAEFPDELNSDKYNQRPLIDQLRQLTTEGDLKWIKAGISEERIKLAGLLISLLEPFDQAPAVHDYLWQLWTNASPQMRAQLIWRILDKPGLGEDKKRELLDFVLTNWTTFNTAATKFLSKHASVIEQVRQRLLDPRWPEKKWIYLCRLVQPEVDQFAVRQLLEEHLHDNDGFTRCVAQTLLNRFFPTVTTIKIEQPT